MSLIKRKTLKKAISTVTAITTVVWLSGVSMLAMPSMAAAAIADGALIKSNATNSDGTPTLESLDVYIVKVVGDKKFKRLILNPTVFDSYGHLNWGDIQTVSQSVMDEYTTSNLVRVDTDPDEKVYAMAPDGDIGSKSWINLSAEDFLGVTGSDPDSIYTINATDGENYNAVDDITTTDELEAFYTDGTLPGANQGSGLTVALSADTPAASTLVNGQAVAHLADFTFTGNGTVKSLTLKRIGVSADTTPSNVYLFDGDTRITDGASFSSGSVLTFSSATSLFEVNGTKTISVKSDIADSTSGQTVGVELNAVTLASGSVTGLPVSGNLHSIASADLATVAVGTATASGDTDAGTRILVWQGTVTVGTRDVLLNRLALRQIGSIAAADIENFVLNIDGKDVATVDALDANGYVTFSVSEALKTGARIIKVYADVIGGASRNVQMSLRGAYDITSVDTQYNANVLATGTFPASPTAFTINSGTMTVVKATDSQSSNLTVGASDQSLATYTFTAYGEPIKIETLNIGILGTTTGTITDETLRNVRVMVDGSQVGATTNVPLAASFAAASGTQFTTNFVVTPGTSVEVEVRGDLVDTTDAGGDTTDDISGGVLTAVQAVLVGGAGSANAVPQTSLGTINVPSTANVLGNSLTIASGSMSIAKTSNYGDQTVVVPQSAYKIGSYQLTGNSTEAVNLNTIYVGWDGAQTGDPATDLSDLYVVYGSDTTSVKGSVSSTALNGNSWSINKTLAVNETMQVDVYATIASSLSTNNIISTLAVAGTTADSNIVTYADASGTTTLTAGVTGQTITGGTGSIAIALDASTKPSAIVSDSGTLDSETVKFTATNDNYTVTDMTVTLGDATAVSTVTLTDGTTTYATKPGATTVAFSGLSIPVPANGSKVITVQLALSPVGVGAGTTGASLLTTVTSATARNTGGTSGAVTGTSVAGNAMYVYHATPVIENMALPSSLLVGAGATNTLAKIKVSSAGNTIGWAKLVFTVTKSMTNSSTGISNITLWDVTSGSTQVLGSGTTTVTSAASSTGVITFIPTLEQQVSGSKTYELRADVAGVVATNDTITTKILQPSTYHSSLQAFAYNDDSGSTIYYADLDADHAVSAGDVRKTAQDKFEVGETTDAGNEQTLGAVSLAYGMTDGSTITISTDASDKLGATPVATTESGVTCTAYDSGDSALTTGDAIASVAYIKCEGTAKSLKVVLTGGLSGDSAANSIVDTISKTTGGYAAGSPVEAGQSDLDLTLTDGVAGDASFIWSDLSAASHATTTTDWTNDTLVKNLPTDTQNLTK